MSARPGEDVRHLGHQSLRALDWLNFFLAALLSGFGPFVALYLAGQDWAAPSIGLVLTAGTFAGLLSQVPGGELLDSVRSKRLLIAVGVVMLALAALLFVLWPSVPFVFVAAVLQGASGGVLGPGIAAISLGLVGHAALAGRLGRNQRLASVGGFTAAGLMGLIGYLLSSRDIFFAAAALAFPVLLALSRIRAADIHFGRSCGAPDHHDQAANPPRINRAVLFKNYHLVVFAGCTFLFQMANASMLPLVGEALGRNEGRQSSLILSALIVIPQLIVALLAPTVGRYAETWGRRPLLLIGFCALPIRAVLFAFFITPATLIAAQMLDGLSGAALGVLTALVIADLTHRTGRFNLAQGFVGTFSGIGASLSTTVWGFVVANLGHTVGFLGIAAVALAAVAMIWFLIPETKPLNSSRPAPPRASAAL